MFNLKVHMEIIAYRIYNEATNIKRKCIQFEEFRCQYYKEQCDKKLTDELEQDYKRLLINTRVAKVYNEVTHEIGIMRYARF